MNCNPAEFYPFSVYTWKLLLIEAAIPSLFIILGVIAFLHFNNRRKSGQRISTIRRIVIMIAVFGGILGVRICMERLPRIYGYVTLPKNYQERHTKIIAIDFDPKGFNLGKCVVTHKMEIDYKEIVHETSIYNKEIIDSLRSYKSGNRTYWIYYNPNKPDVYLADFRATVDKQKSVCEEGR